MVLTYFLPPDFLSYPAPQEGKPAPGGDPTPAQGNPTPGDDLTSPQGEPAPGGDPTPLQGNKDPIRLGQLISNHKDPSYTIASLDPLDLAKYGIFPNKVVGSAMEHNNSESSSSHASFFLKAVELIGTKLGFSIQHGDSQSLLSEIEEFEARSIVVTDDYIKASMSQKKLQDSIKGFIFDDNVYVVDAILIAKPKSDKSKITMSAQATSEASGNLELGGQPAQIPIQGGGDFQRKASKKYGLAFVPSTPFIYGFRIRECFYRKGRAKSTAVTKGAKLTAERGQVEMVAEEEAHVVFSGLADENVTVGDLGEEAYGLEELKVRGDAGGEECTLVVPWLKH